MRSKKVRDYILSFFLHKTSANESKKLLSSMLQNDSASSYVDMVLQTYAKENPLKFSEDDLKKGFRNVLFRSRIRRNKMVILRIAAVVLFGLFSSSVIYLAVLKDRTPQGSKVVRIVVEKINSEAGEIKKVILSDGTKVWLAPKSMLSAPRRFFGRTREVSLSGQAYFEVVHNSQKKFIVKTKSSRVVVLGTKFNVTSYSDELNDEVVLVQGSVNVSFGSKGKSIVNLHPNQKISIKKYEEDYKLETIDALSFVEWKDGVFKFKNERFEDVLRKLEKNKNVHFVVNDQTLLSRRFTGRFDHENVEEILLTLSKIYHFEYTKMKNNSYEIKNFAYE